jgi:hypothetical protein
VELTDDEFTRAIDALMARAIRGAETHAEVTAHAHATKADLDSLFSRCTRAALRRPDPIARSMILRRLVRTLVPHALRPTVKRLVLATLRRGGARR